MPSESTTPPLLTIGPCPGCSTSDAVLHRLAAGDRRCSACAARRTPCARCDLFTASPTAHRGTSYCRDCWAAIGGRNCRACGDPFMASPGSPSDLACNTCRRAEDDRNRDEVPCSCASCRDGGRSSSTDDRVIRDYSDRTAARYPFRGKPHGGIYLGVELEVEVASGGRINKARACLDLLNGDGPFAVAKGDGSLNDGFELVSAPASLDEARRLWSLLLDRVPPGLRSHDTETCGLHVHASRGRPGRTGGVSPLTLGKLMYFFGENPGFIEAVAGRSSSRWARIDKKKVADALEATPGYGERYQAINTLNEKTIEFRVFKGTLKKETFLARIEFVDAVIRWASQEGASGPLLTVPRFAGWCGKSHKTYPYLVAWLIEQGHLPARPRRNPDGSNPAVIARSRRRKRHRLLVASTV